MTASIFFHIPLVPHIEHPPRRVRSLSSLAITRLKHIFRYLINPVIDGVRSKEGQSKPRLIRSEKILNIGGLEIYGFRRCKKE